jgi:imidazolonepropionase-like amidohydrolase
MIASWPKLKTAADADTFVHDQISNCGASYIKLMHELGDTIGMSLPRPPLEVQKAVVEAAHSNGLIAVGHAFSYQGTMDLLSCGVDGLTHIFLDKPPSDDYITLCKRNNAHCNPTLSTGGSQTREGDEIQAKFAADSLSQEMLFDKKARLPLGMGAANASIEHGYESTKALYNAGVPIVIGSDSSGQARGTAYGLGVHIEIYLLTHKVKMTATDVLKGATSLIADRFGFHDRGRIAIGKKADLVLIEGDVRKILADEQKLCLPLQGVWRDGVLASVYENRTIA